MKVRNISLVGAGAIISVALIALTFTLFNPPKARADAAAAAVPGTGAMVVTVPPYITGQLGVNPGNGVITINDSTVKRVTVVCYSFKVDGSGPHITLSTPASFAYQ